MQVTTNGVELHVADLGHGPPLLLLHAFPLHGAMWHAQVDALQQHYRLVVPDVRGFGGSPLPPRSYSLDEVAADMLGLLDALGIEQATVAGLSMGGYVALAMFRRAPERFRALVLADTRAAADSEETQVARRAAAYTARQQGVAPVVDALLPRVLGASTQRSKAAVVAGVRQLMGEASPEALARAQEAMAARADSLPLLASIAVPTLVLVGEEDVTTPPEEARAMAEAIAGAEVVEIAGAGHLSSLEQPEAFTAALRSFLERLR